MLVCVPWFRGWLVVVGWFHSLQQYWYHIITASFLPTSQPVPVAQATYIPVHADHRTKGRCLLLRASLCIRLISDRTDFEFRHVLLHTTDFRRRPLETLVLVSGCLHIYWRLHQLLFIEMTTYSEASQTDAEVEEEVHLHMLAKGGKLHSKAVQLHNLPCRIHSNGAAPVSEYFNVVDGSDSSNNDAAANGSSSASTAHAHASFRGRKLAATKVPLPAGARGVVLSERFSSDPGDVGGGGGAAGGDVRQRAFEEVGHFQHVMHWDRDTVKQGNQLASSLQWIHLARAVGRSCAPAHCCVFRPDCVWLLL